MSGFSPEWLGLREPADLAARDPALLVRAVSAARRAAHARGAVRPVIVDLGCGTGATVRAMAPHLGDGAHWRLVDHDPRLLALAKGAAGPGARAFAMDLRTVGDLPLGGADLVACSALLDLVSGEWLAALADRLAGLGCAFHAALSYDGVMRWTPDLPADAAVTEGFNRHQRRDKGLGPALGPGAPAAAAASLKARGFDIACAASPWRLCGSQARLQAALVDGIALAAAEAGVAGAESWAQARREAAGAGALCEVGHVDVLALPFAPATSQSNRISLPSP